MSRTYDKPEQSANARAIRPQQQPNTLGPDTEVTVLFRGGPPIIDMWDSLDWVIPPRPEGVELLEDYRGHWCEPEYFTMPYAVAQHLQQRAVVPGTRNPTDPQQIASQLAILNIDPPARCQPFTREQLERFGGAFKEGLDRSLIPDAPVVDFVDVAGVVANLNVERALQDAADADRGFNRDVQGSEAVRTAQAGEVHAAAQNIRVSPTKAGKVKFKDDPQGA